MSNYLIPASDDLIEKVAKSIARDRLYRDAIRSININIENVPHSEDLFDPIFERLWSGDSQHDRAQKESYRDDARAAINTINLILLTSTE